MSDGSFLEISTLTRSGARACHHAKRMKVTGVPRNHSIEVLVSGPVSVSL